MCRFKTGSSKKTKNNVKAKFKRSFHLFLKITLTGLKVAENLKVVLMGVSIMYQLPIKAMTLIIEDTRRHDEPDH